MNRLGDWYYLLPFHYLIRLAILAGVIAAFRPATWPVFAGGAAWGWSLLGADGVPARLSGLCGRTALPLVLSRGLLAGAGLVDTPGRASGDDVLAHSGLVRPFRPPAQTLGDADAPADPDDPLLGSADGGGGIDAEYRRLCPGPCVRRLDRLCHALVGKAGGIIWFEATPSGQ